MLKEEKSNSLAKVVFNWVWPAILFFLAYGLLSGFLEPLIANAFNQSLILDGVIYNGANSLKLFAVIILSLLLIVMLIYWLLKAFPDSSYVGKILFVIVTIDVIITYFHDDLKIPKNLSHFLLLLYTLIAAFISINRFKKKVLN